MTLAFKRVYGIAEFYSFLGPLRSCSVFAFSSLSKDSLSMARRDLIPVSTCE